MARRRRNNAAGDAIGGVFGFILMLVVFPTIKAVKAFSDFFNQNYGFFVLSVIGIFTVWLGWKCFEYLYYQSKGFLVLKSRISKYIEECNELNEYICALRETKIGEKRLPIGYGVYHDNSVRNYKRPELTDLKEGPTVHFCSRQVVANAKREPFKYLEKYFGFMAEESVLRDVENLLNNYEAAEDGKKKLLAKKQSIMNSIDSEIPYIIRKFSKNLESELGFDNVQFEEKYYPIYTFRYESSGGYSGDQVDIPLDLKNLNGLVEYIFCRLKQKNSVKGQRRMLTSKLRQQILYRDHYTCQYCHASAKQEKHLLLEVDHKRPLSRGGMTEWDNLWTLCWRCNRRKGNKLVSEMDESVILKDIYPV